jgi:hypothetical protein
MNAVITDAPVKLAPPGAGLPLHEAWTLRLFGRFMLRRGTTWDSALDDIEAISDRMIARFSALPLEIQSTRVLVKRLQGLEDSSRYWSPAMVLEHLCITGEAMLGMVILLSNGGTSSRRVSTADVKPVGLPPGEVLQSFTTLHRGARPRLRERCGPEREGGKHRHPWFGALHATDWLRMTAFHLRLHEKQMELILGG